MELRHIRYFMTVAEELHFGRAAERLHVSQPPLSQQIRQLEAELGVELFQRNQRHVQLTGAGKRYYEEVRLIFERLDQAAHFARQAAEGQTGTLAVGFVASATYALLPLLYRRFREAYPMVGLNLSELSTAEQVDALNSGQIEVGIARPPVGDSTLLTEPLVEEPLMVALPSSHAMAQKEAIALRELRSERFVLFPRRPRPGWIDVVRRACEAADFFPTVAQEVQELSSAVTLVAAGIGVALVPASAQALSLSGVVYKHFEPPVPTTHLLALRRAEEPSVLVVHFLAVAREVVRAELHLN
jgi:LysR family transcriptional regulator, benzoate and cis,cis-muconate-responsive activator of ben and cat genes